MILFGSGKFALNLLHNLLNRNVDIEGVVTKPNPDKGAPAEQIRETAEEHNISVLQPNQLNQNFAKEIGKIGAKTGVVADFAKVLPPEIIYSFPNNVLGLHPSLLPSYRGPAPIQYTLLNGDEETGVTLFVLEEEIDTGPVVSSAGLEIESIDNTETLFVKLAELGAQVIQDTLPKWESGNITPQSQDETQASLTKKIKKEDAHIDWELPDMDIYNMIRAYYSWPVAYTIWEHNNKKTRLQILEASIDPDLYETEAHNYQAGEVFTTEEGAFAIACGTGAIVPKRVKIEGKNEITNEDLANGYSEMIGEKLN